MEVWRSLIGIAAVVALPHFADAGERLGASVPWVSYEAESARTNGIVLGPDFSGQTPAREASGRQCVKLSSTGQYVEFTANGDANGVVVRYCIPDSSDGRGIDATLGLYVNGKLATKLKLSSKLCYLYGEYPFSNDSQKLSPRHFWEEVHSMPGEIHAGDVVRLQKDADDTASEYLIDLVDLERVPAPLNQPASAVSVKDCGAAGDAKTDDRGAFVAAIAKAKQQHVPVWIPPGQYLVKGPLEVSDVAVLGAGIWYSALLGVEDYSPQNRVAIYGTGSNVKLADFAITGNLNYRSDSEPNDGIGGEFGTGSAISNIWVEHTKTGAWIANSDGLVVEGCRFRDTIADGINLCLGMRNTTVRNCSARGTGDDCFAMWPATYMKSKYHHGLNRFVNCTAQLPFLAQGFSIYGGESNSVEKCEAIDIPYGAGLLANTRFPTEFGFEGKTTFRHIRTDRAGCDDGAIGIAAWQLDLAGLVFDDIEVLNSPSDGIKFASVDGRKRSAAEFNEIRIVNPGIGGAGCGIVAAAGAVGSASISHVSVVQPKTKGCDLAATDFKLIQGIGNSGLDESDRTTAASAAQRISAAQPASASP